MLAWFTFGVAVLALWLALGLYIAAVWVALKAKPYVGMLAMFMPAEAPAEPETHADGVVERIEEWTGEA